MAIDLWWYESRRQWCVDVPAQNGRKRLYLGPNEAKARAELHRYMATYYDKLGQEPADSKPSLKRGADSMSLVDLAVRFIKWNKANRARATATSYRDGLKYITRQYQGNLAEELTASDVERLKTQMIEDGYAARTINIMVTAVKRMYSWAVKQGLIAHNALSGIEHVSKHVNAPDRPEDKHLTLDRAEAYIEVCRKSPPLGDICEMLLLTGMRVGEVTRVSWQDVDFSQRMLRLERHKTSGLHNSRPRTIPLCQRAIDILRNRAPRDLQADMPVFLGHKGQPFTVSSLHCRLQRLRKRHPELKDFSFHKLRHTCATYLARLKVPERVAQAILGHSSTLMTRYYTATDKDEMIEAVERLSGQIASRPASRPAQQ
ncbi:MAG: site-specific integrase [Candidatus Brocadiae bacterium]|nr:site-specific integrase [Candidatus Brocadiia bacterium]